MTGSHPVVRQLATPGLADGRGAPFRSLKASVARSGGIEEEFTVAGDATQFRLRNGATHYRADGCWDAEPGDQQPYCTRLLVERPVDDDAFNGAVVLYWNNVSMGEDLFLEGNLAAQLVRDGFALVGVTTQRVGVDGPTWRNGGVSPDKQPPGKGLRHYDPERYGALVHPGDGYSYDIFTQVAGVVGNPARGPDPLAGLTVRYRIAMGGSQSASRLASYLNAIQPASHAFNAFLLNVYAGIPCALDPATAPASLPGVRDNVFHLLAPGSYAIREPDVPVIVLNSECELEVFDCTYQPDTEYLRFWEVAGTAHFGTLSDEALVSMFRAAAASACRVSFAPANRGALHALRRWLGGEPPPPHQPRLRKVGAPPALRRDQHGNAVGGIRWPDLEAPLATHVGYSSNDGLMSMMGATTPFSAAKVRSLYPGRDAWLTQYREAADRLVKTRVVLADDAADMVARASTIDLWR